MSELERLKKEVQRLIEENVRLEEANSKLNERLIELYILYQLTRQLSLSLNINELFERTMTLIQEMLHLNEYSIMLLNEETGMLEIRASKGVKDEVITRCQARPGEGLSGKVAALSEPVLVADLTMVKEHIYYPNSGYEKGSYLGVPLLAKDGRVLGVINFHNPEPASFNQRDLKLFEAVAEQISISLDNALTFQLTKELTNRDELTKLYNRRYFFDRMEREVERAKRYNRKLALLMIDIDHFKNYNDSYGHLQGDEVLRQLASTLEKNLRKVDIVARYGGEEFLVLLPETDKHSGQRVAEKLRKAVEKHDFHHRIPALGPVKVTVTVGVSSFPQDTQDSFELLDLADKAMYFGKAQGRNRVCAEIPAGK
jgi:diguanylate cyclase (GGDEF)-like protein